MNASVSGQTITLARHNGDTVVLTVPYAVQTEALYSNELTRTSPAGRTAVALRQGENSSDAFRAEIVDFGWDYSDRDGALIGLASASNPTAPGYFYIHARNADNSTTLVGRPGGTLTWDGQQVITINDVASSNANGLMSAEDKSKLDNIGPATITKMGLLDITNQTVAGRKNIKGNNTGWSVINADNTYGCSLWMGNGINRGLYDNTNGRWIVYANATTYYFNGHQLNADVPADAKFTDTTYEDATQSTHGLMSANDKTYLDYSKFATGSEVFFYGPFAAYITTNATELDFLVPLAFIPPNNATSVRFVGLIYRKPSGGTVQLDVNNLTLVSMITRNTGIEIRLRGTTALSDVNNISITLLGNLYITF